MMSCTLFPGRRGGAVDVADGRVEAHAGEARVGAAVSRPRGAGLGLLLLLLLGLLLLLLLSKLVKSSPRFCVQHLLFCSASVVWPVGRN